MVMGAPTGGKSAGAGAEQFERIRFVSVRPAAGRTGRRLFQVTKGAEAH